jgi:DNA primase
VYNAWAIYFKKMNGRDPFDKNSVMKYIRDEPYFDKAKSGQVRINGISRKAIAIDKAKATGSILELFEMAEKNRLAEGFYADDE